MNNDVKPVRLQQVSITGGFWLKYITLVRDTVIPYQWEALNDRVADAEPSHAIENYRIAAGEAEGEFAGYVFQDSDIAKWLESVAYRLALYPDDELEKTADGVIDLIGRAQRTDGYLDTYFIVKDPDSKWTNLQEQHELYCAGHLIEAAVEYYLATGKEKLIDIVEKLIDHIGGLFGTGSGQRRGYPGHQEIELALVKLYRATGRRRHLELATYFIDERGKDPKYFEKESLKNAGQKRTDFWEKFGYEYGQAHRPVREQTEAVGHAVRAGYMYSAMADLAFENQDESLSDACRTLWNNIERKRSYVHGAIGSEDYGESFTFDYDLQNDTICGETCAAISLVFFAHRMLFLEIDSRYADMLERALYNGIISGISLDGTRFFYVNPLEVRPAECLGRKDRNHVKTERQRWFGCACCPPNIARTLISLGKYLYTSQSSSIHIHLYVASKATIDLGGVPVMIRQETNYPLDGEVDLSIDLGKEHQFTMAMRIPSWCSSAPNITVNGKPAEIVLKRGYACIDRKWRSGDVIRLSLNTDVRIVRANPAVSADIGKACVFRGPLLYCIEEVDNGPDLHNAYLASDASFKEKFEPGLLGGVITLETDGVQLETDKWDDELYRSTPKPVTVPRRLKFIPYYAWCNREPGEMYVWIREQLR